MTFKALSGRINTMVEESTPVKKPSIIEKFVPVLLVLSVVLAFFVGTLWERVKTLEKGGATSQTSQTGGAQTATVDLKTIKSLWDKNLIKFGDTNRKVLFVEIIDPSCPYCHVAGGQDPEIATQIGTQFKYASAGGAYQPPVTEMKKLVDSGKASIAFIYFPGHNNGEMGMKALYCAYDQGKFWEAQDLIMSNAGYNLQNTTVKNDKTKSQVVADFLKGVTNVGDLKKCLDSGKYDGRLTDEQNLASSLAVAGTPGFFINATRFDGAYSWSDMKATVDAALK